MHAEVARSGFWHVIAPGTLLIALWLIFLTYWLVAAIRVKRSVSGTWWRGSIFRAAIAVGIVLLLRESLREHVWRQVPHAVTNGNPVWASVGVAVCALGIGIAIWARTHLGRNWGMPMSLREGHELVTSGPYAFVRHPIYTGILIAVIGTTLVEWFPWLVLLACIFAYFVYAARVEEGSMTRQFPNEYPGYAARTKLLIPFLL
ncbi:MAG: isoprenylcysteine carboxylmethyltransferase family protein [Candidatus Baltobacteraceae bacterium]